MIKTKVTVKTPEQGYGAILFNVFKKSAIPAFKAESEAMAADMVKDIKRRLRRQLFNHQELSPKYHKRKIRFGYDPRILIASRQYYNAITVIKTEYGAKVGVKEINHYPNMMADNWESQQKKARKRKGGSPGTVPMLLLAKWLEFGTTRAKMGRGGPSAGQPWYMPPRPHWRPVMSKFAREHDIIKRKFTKRMQEAMAGALETELANARMRETKLG